MTVKNLIACFLLAAVATTGLGCGRAISEAVGTVRGAKGLYAPIQMLDKDKEARPLGEYRRFELGQITDDFGGKVPPAMWVHLREEFAEQLAIKKLPDDPSGKTLSIRGRIFHYEDASMLGFVIGPLEEVVARIELVDKSSGKVLATANCIGRTTEAMNAGVARKGQGLARAIVSWLDGRYPKEAREE